MNKEYNLVSRAERLSWLDVLKGIGIILVVIGHVYSNRTVFNWLYSFHMPLFFLAAGWVYKEKSVLTDIKRRIQTIVVPYFSFGLLVLLYWQVIERRFRNSDMSFMDSLLGLFSGCYDNLDFNVHLWFLPCFFVTVALFNILVNLGGRKFAYIAAVLMSLVYVVLTMPELPWGFNRVFKYIGCKGAWFDLYWYCSRSPRSSPGTIWGGRPRSTLAGRYRERSRRSTRRGISWRRFSGVSG